MKIMLKTTFALMIFAFPAVAEKLNSKQIPASAQWVIHMDFDGFKTSEMGKFAMKQMDEHAGAIDALSAMLKFDPRMDLADVTAFGHVDAEHPDENGVALIRGKFDQEHLLTLLKPTKPSKPRNQANTNYILGGMKIPVSANTAPSSTRTFW